MAIVHAISKQDVQWSELCCMTLIDTSKLLACNNDIFIVYPNFVIIHT